MTYSQLLDIANRTLQDETTEDIPRDEIACSRDSEFDYESLDCIEN